VLRSRGRHHGPKIAALRAHRQRYDVRSGATNRNEPQRKLLFEARREAAP
jgi:hypothetical protein